MVVLDMSRSSELNNSEMAHKTIINEALKRFKIATKAPEIYLR